MSAQALSQQEFGIITELVKAHAREQPHHAAVVKDEDRLSFAELDRLMDRVAAALQRDGLRTGDVIAICALSSVEYVGVFLGALRAGIAVAPLAPSSTSESLAGMISDCGAKKLFLDASVANAVPLHKSADDVQRISLDGGRFATPLSEWLAPLGAEPQPVTIAPGAPFNIIYSSGTTGTPKGIVQPHRMRWAHVKRAAGSGYDRTAVTLCSTPLYSNTTLVSFFPALAAGGTIVLMAKFDATKFLELCQRHRVTHAMLVPVQYQRIMDVPDFAGYDLSSFRMKFCTSAPFPAALKADILRCWPGGLTEYYGMTEGGATFILHAHLHPTKLHTVGQPAPEHEVRLLDELGNEVPRGQVGEVVGRSPAAMMTGYYKQAAKTSEAEWYDKDGTRFIRTGDIGRFDEDGFLTLLDRKKDMIISGGFNVYPSDLEAVLLQHEAVKDAAVVGITSQQWGETPVAFVELKAGRSENARNRFDYGRTNGWARRSA